VPAPPAVEPAAADGARERAAVLPGHAARRNGVDVPAQQQATAAARPRRARDQVAPAAVAAVLARQLVLRALEERGVVRLDRHALALQPGLEHALGRGL